MDSLKDKVVIVTGCSSGMGLATAETLLKFGSKVFGCDINSYPASSPLSSASSHDFVFLQCNLTQPNVPAQVVQDCTKAFGDKIYGLLNIAGVMDTNNSVDTLTDELWDRVIAINLTAPVKLMREVIPFMIKGGGGSIVNVSSKAGTSGAVAGVAYTSSKHGIVGATKNVAWRFKDNDIRCNAICPGGISSNIIQSIDVNNMDLAALEVISPVHNLIANHSTKKLRMAPAQAAADVIVFLVSDMSSEISGAVIPVDHAWSTV